MKNNKLQANRNTNYRNTEIKNQINRNTFYRREIQITIIQKYKVKKFSFY